MGIKAVFDIQKPDEVMMRMTTTMKMADWKKVREALKLQDGDTRDYWHPAEEFDRIIDDLVRQAEKAFWADASEPAA